MLLLIDTNNTFRAFAEKCSSGMPIREFFQNAYNSTEKEVYVFDGPGGLAKRRSIFPGYKVGRAGAPDNFYVHLGILEEMLMHSGKIIIKMPGWEADDVIATLAQTVSDPVVIDSTDKDFTRLISDRVQVPRAKLPEGVSAQDLQLYKSLVGDTSDKLPGLVKFGHKSFVALTLQQKINWENLLLDNVPLHEFDMGDELGVKSVKLQETLEKDIELLKAYWKVVDFFPVDQKEILKAMRFGIPNWQLANKLLTEMHQ